MLKWFVTACVLIPTVALAQQQDPAKMAQAYRQQRDIANDGIAQCAVSVAELQAKIADLEKQLASAKADK